MTSSRKTQSNRKNAKQSTGPKSAAGKSRAKRNAVKHGFYSRELMLTEEQANELEQLREQLRTQFRPTTPLQELAFEEIVCCAWRCRMAIRLEMIRVIAFEKTGDQAEPELTSATGPALELQHWYGAGRQELRNGIRFLSRVRNGSVGLGRIPEDLHESFIKGFGPTFYELLVSWTPASLDAILLAHQTVEQAKLFGWSPFPEGERPKDVIQDPFQSQQMVLKLIDQELMHLEALARSFDQRRNFTNAYQSVTEFAPRYFTTATRDLHRAVDWYTHLKEQKL